MKKIMIFMGIAMGLLAGCKPAPKAVLTSGIDLANLDTTASPVNDFYQYACGGWIKRHPLSPEYARFGTFDQLAEDNQARLKDLVTELANKQNAPGSIPDKIATLYKLGMDSVKLQQQGTAPLKPWLEEIAQLNTKPELQKELVTLQKYGIMPFFSLDAEADNSNSKMTIAFLNQDGLGIGDRDYYLQNDPHMKDIRTKYVDLMTRLFALSGYADMVHQPAAKLASEVMNLETQLAKISWDRVTLRDPHKNFNKMDIKQLVALAPDFGFQNYFQEVGVPQVKELNVGQPTFFKAADGIFKNSSPDVVKAYFAWNLINSASPYLSDAFANASFDFYGKALSGRQEMRPRWKRVISSVDGAMGEALGEMYVAKYFPPAAKERMVQLVKNLQNAFAERIREAAWMSQATKDTAIAKLYAIHIKIGYPDKWRDYSGLQILNDSYFADVMRSRQFEMNYIINKIDKPTDVNEWQMTPQTVNAYYNPTTNEICFPAAILQPPFFQQNADDAANYGAIGVVIGHEMTHGFDDQGRQYDKFGNLKNWWTPQDAKNFVSRADVLSKWFSSIQVAPNTYGNGAFTLGENLADNGGLHISFLAMENALKAGKINPNKMDGFTPQQRFFLAYATVWAGNIRPEEIIRRTKEDPHSLGKWRVDGALPNIEAFIKAFNIKAGDRMYLPEDKQAHIW
ncbi:M13 family metallopeptidase [Microbacter margulisiae]|uniref:Putative endopeptidase n=1 Tax=Microbacter margulisiae TaxID=1350067 RepID=A0A7W5DPC1_9PORP|nr:M13 family metallopeptidase [Microbacter margulisiae]MBB3186502.1 putative endopeptidase [Microbacter margulisiae]